MPSDVPDSGSRQTLALPCDISSVTEARTALLAALEEQGADDRLASDAATVFSELLINAVLHGNPGDQGEVRGSWSIGAAPAAPGHRVVLTVHDAGGYGVPRIEPADEDAPAGRGLRIVEAMSDSWSVDTDDGTTVTAALTTRRVDLPGR